MKKRLFKKKTPLKRTTKQESGVFKFTVKLKKIAERLHKKTEGIIESVKKDSEKSLPGLK